MLKRQRLVWSICEHCLRQTRPLTRLSGAFSTSTDKGVAQRTALHCPEPDPLPWSAFGSSSLWRTTTFRIETYETDQLSPTQLRSLRRANRLATRATIMPAARTKKGDAPNVSNEANKMNQASVKRKRRPGEQRFYAVRAGKIPGVYMSWAECQAMTNGFAGANYKSFSTYDEAALYVAGKNPNPGVAPTRFYAVAIGNKPGVYTEWSDAQAAYVGVKAPKYKKFDSREAAEEWIQSIRLSAGPAPEETFDFKDEDGDEDDEDEDAGVSPAAKRTKLSSDEIALAITGETVEDLLEIYTDGSTLSNGQTGAVAGVGVFFGDGDPRNISERLSGTPQTNQRAELTAILRALETVPLDQGVMIWSDSMYAINCVTEWFVKWEKNGWKTHKGQVQNRDLVEAVLVKIRERESHGTTTLIKWIKGHESSAGNISADKLAVGGANMAKSGRGRR
ncbi:hypothetical protein KVR01_009854 [Diaporthe batatas]|uniref:uncharacterized protein n=1 Tax=Diaporthe batatas TaxID=748121 RepID=UPI001D04C9D1|nr:uncharacterized protein KVR01_009854 [Diaporthe batatas]KAG8160318.1 hypothetical protein KVR01_009854 [Diaporthe batatas]